MDIQTLKALISVTQAVNMKRSAAQIIPNNDIILSDRPARAGW